MRTGTLEKIVARGPTNAPLHIMVRSKYAVLMPLGEAKKKAVYFSQFKYQRCDKYWRLYFP